MKSVEAVNMTGALTPPKKRAWVKLDKYAFDYFDHHHLSASERHVLLAICLEVRWQDHCWYGSITDLSGRTRMGRKTVSETMKSLVMKEILEPICDFSANSMGQFVLLNYDDLIIPEAHSGGRPKGSKDAEPRLRTQPDRDHARTQLESNEGLNATKTTQFVHNEGSKTLMKIGNGYNSPREAEIREEGNSANGIVAEGLLKTGDDPTLSQDPFALLDMPCGICGDQKAGHIWITEDGRGHDWEPRKGGLGYVGF